MISLERAVYFLVLAFPVTIISMQPLGSVIYLLLSIIGIYAVVARKISPFKIKELRLFSWIALIHFTTMALSIVLSSELTSDLLHLSRKLQFLLAPFVALAIFLINPNPNIRQINQAIKVGAILIGLIVISQYLSGFSGRLSGMFNANTFGDIAVFLTIFSLVMVGKESNREFIYAIIAFVFGITAIVFSGSRGAMLLFVSLMLLYFVFSYKYFYKKTLRYILIALVGGATFYFAYHITNSQHRTTQIIENIEQWQSGKKISTSNGLRLEMLNKGWKAYLDSPWIGYGYRNSNYVTAKYVEDEHAKQLIAGYSHLHNTYLTHMVNAGIFGLVSILILFGIPLFYFIKGLRVSDIYEVSVMGILLVVGYLSIGMVHSSINEEYKNSFVLLFLALLLPKVLMGLDTKR